MTVQQVIESKLATLDPSHLEVVNESGNHNVPPGSESHFKVVLVSSRFEGLRAIQRHRVIHELLSEEISGPIHALALHLYTDADWTKRFGEAPKSPPCLGGSKAG
ncbi:MAG: BolA/IbaG family iron-sulfur metabolism protein [Gammaproteobacteria bacterium]|nr:BolA/IbaG family iron-sulfur metabolism protein [Gammaproteobacteria bacterium]MYD80273.1 BolA/IbaG family iron-sulfur metabolism protein [Gammaproteobacteria bacterium]